MKIHDTIGQLLVDDARRALPGDDFTHRVMARLPSPAVCGARWRPVLVIGSAALGSILAMTLAPAGPALLEGFGDFVRTGMTQSAVAALTTAIAMAATALIVAFVAD